MNRKRPLERVERRAGPLEAQPRRLPRRRLVGPAAVLLGWPWARLVGRHAQVGRGAGCDEVEEEAGAGARLVVADRCRGGEHLQLMARARLTRPLLRLLGGHSASFTRGAVGGLALEATALGAASGDEDAWP